MTFEAVKEEWRRLGVGSGAVCRDCPALVKRPLLPWQVGKDFGGSDRRVVFVGKPHRGGDTEAHDVGVPMDRSRLASTDLRFRPWPYWSYTLDIADRVHGRGLGWDRVALTNIVKCTNVRDQDTFSDSTAPEMIRRCVSELGVIWAEVRVLEATHVVLYTHAAPFGAHVRDIPLGIVRRESRAEVSCGARALPWWVRDLEVEWGAMRVLVTGHPQLKKRADFVRLVSDWILEAVP